MNINLIETYIEANGHGYSNDTITSYLTDIRQFLDFIKESTGTSDDVEAIQQLQYLHCVKYLTHMRERNLSPFTMNRKLSCLSKFIDFCIDLQLTDHNSIRKIRRFVTTDIEQDNDYLTRDEYLALIETIKSTPTTKKGGSFIVARDTLLFTLLLTTGLRITEARSLKLRQVDLENKRIRPLRKGRRFQDIDITDELVELLEDYLIERKNIHLDSESEELVFTSVNGNPLSTRDCNRTLQKYCARANIKAVTCHDLRHTCATNLMRRGANLEDVSNLLGHRSISTTSRYIHGEASHVSKLMGL